MDKNTEIKKNVPELRFPGFTDAWEQRKLREVLTLLKDGTHGTHKDVEDGPLLLSAKNIKNGTVQWDTSDRRISKDEYESIHANFKLHDGDVLLTIVGSIGETAILSHSEGLTFQRSVAFLRPDNELISEFLYSEIQGHKFQKELDDRKSTSAQPGIYLGDLGEIPINYPKNINEQFAIGQYFTSLDHLITLHQRKCDLMKEYKKGVANKLFNDVNNSESRMERLGDIINILPKTKHPAGVALSSGAYRFFTNDTGSKISYLDTFDYNTEAIIANTGGVANFKYYDGPFSVSMHCLVFEPIDPYALYLYHYLNTKKTEIDRGGFRGSGLKALDKEFLLNTIIPIPDYEIQKKIGNTLTEIDKKIACEEKMIEDMKEYKKGLLQKMFI